MQLALTTAASITAGVCIVTLVGCVALLALIWLPQHTDTPRDDAGDDSIPEVRLPADTFVMVGDRARTADDVFAQLAGPTPVSYHPLVEVGPDPITAELPVTPAPVSPPTATRRSPVPAPPVTIGIDPVADLEAAYEVQRICRAAIDEYDQDAERANRDADAADQAADRLDADADAAEFAASGDTLSAAVVAAREAATRERQTAAELRTLARAHQRDADALRVQLARIEATMLRDPAPATADGSVERVDTPADTNAAAPTSLDAPDDPAVALAVHAPQDEPADTIAVSADDVPGHAIDPSAPATDELDVLSSEPAITGAGSNDAVPADEATEPDDRPADDRVASRDVAFPAPVGTPTSVWPAPTVEPPVAAGDPVPAPVPQPAAVAEPIVIIAPHVVTPTVGDFASDIADAARLAVAASHALPAGVTYAELEMIEIPEPPVDVSAAFDPARWAAPVTPATPSPAGIEEQQPATAAEDLAQPTDAPVVTPRVAARQARAARRADRAAAKAAAKAARRAPGAPAVRATAPQPEPAPAPAVDLGWPTDDLPVGDGTAMPWPDDRELIALLDTLDATPDDVDDRPAAVPFEAWGQPSDDIIEVSAGPWRPDVDVVDDGPADTPNEVWPAAPDRTAPPAASDPDEWVDHGPATPGLGTASGYDPDAVAQPAAPANTGRRRRREQRRAARELTAVENPTIAGFSRPGAFGDDTADEAGGTHFAELVTLPAPAADEPTDDEPLAGIPGGDIDDLLADTRPIGPAGHRGTPPPPVDEPLTVTLDVPLTSKQARKQAAAAAKRAKRDAAERRRLERRARKAGVEVDEVSDDDADEAWQSPSWVAEPLEIKPVVTPGDTVDYALYDLPEPIPDRAASLEVDERVAAMVDVPIGKASVRWQNEPAT